MSKNAKKTIGTKRSAAALATSITGISSKIDANKKAKKGDANSKSPSNSPTKTTKTVAAAATTAPPAVSLLQQLQSSNTNHSEEEFRSVLLKTAASTQARSQYETFVKSLDFSQKRGELTTVTFGDILQVVPAININKRKFSDLYEVDQRVAQVYADAQDSYNYLREKAESLKINDYAKYVKSLKKKDTKKADDVAPDAKEPTTDQPVAAAAVEPVAAEPVVVVAEPVAVVAVEPVVATELATEPVVDTEPIAETTA